MRGSLRVVAGAAALVLLLTGAAGAERPRILVLGPAEEPRFTEVTRGLREGLAEHGRPPASVEMTEVRVPRGATAAARAAVARAAREGVDVGFVIGSVLAAIARETAPDLPLVFITPGDPVAAGIVTSFRQPGRNMTALTFEYPELSAKRLQILQELAPRVRRVLVIYDARDPSPAQGFAAAQQAGPALGLTVVGAPLRGADPSALVAEHARATDGIVLVPGGGAAAAAAGVIQAATVRRLPVVAAGEREAAQGALAAYGASDVDVAREAARLVDKVLRGARAGELPVERPTRLRLVVNRRAAAALGLALAEGAVLRADRIIE